MRLDFTGAGHMHDIQGADFHTVTGELSEAPHEGCPIEVRKDKLTSLFARAEIDQPPNRLCHYDNATEYSHSESVCEFPP